MRKAGLAVMLSFATLAGLTPQALLAHVEDYGPRRYTQMGRDNRRDRNGDRDRDRDRDRVIIDRTRGPGWGGVAAAGVLGAIAGFALGNAAQPPAVEQFGPPPIGTVVAAIPYGCETVPTYNGAVLYNCGGIYYQPFYEGVSLMYQVVPAP